MDELADTGTLRAFIAIAEAQSFSTGGKRNGLTRSAASKAVSRLEELLGVRLFHRTTRSISLTDEGLTFYDRAKRVLGDLADAQMAVSHQGTLRGVLRITAPEAFGRQVLLPLLGDFLAEWPELSAETNFTDRTIDIVEEGYDLALRLGELPPRSDLISRLIARMVGKLCASPTYLAKYPCPTKIEDMDHHRQLLSGTRERAREWTLQNDAGDVHTIPPNPILLCDSAGALRDAALIGLGVACLPTFLIDDDVSSGRLQILFPDYATTQIPLTILYPSRRQLSRKVRLFINHIANCLSR
jgi:DNA-binding transcriptional LysR family regulator